MKRGKKGRETRDELLAAATHSFAEKGFYGASMAAIASQLGLTKQALIHHFGSKEKLYGEVMQRISDQLLSTAIQAAAERTESESELESFLFAFYSSGEDHLEATQLIMRELLDNRERAESAHSWYLKSFLDALVAMIRRAPGWESASNEDALASVYQLLGAINYFAVSEPTLSPPPSTATASGPPSAPTPRTAMARPKPTARTIPPREPATARRTAAAKASATSRPPSATAAWSASPASPTPTNS